MGRIKTWWNRVRGKTYQVAIIMREDGFIPAAQFQAHSLERTLEASAWSYSCITANAEAASSLAPVVQRAGEQGEDRWVDVRDDDLNELLQEPFGGIRSLPKWDWKQLSETALQQYLLCGNAWIKPLFANRGQKVKALHLLMQPNAMQATEDSRKVPVLFQHGSDKYKPSELVNIMNCSPDSYWRGQSPTRAALQDIETDSLARTRQRYAMENRVGANLVFKVKGYFGPTSEEKKRVEKEISENYQGATKEGTPLIVGEKVDIDKVPDQNLSKEIFDARNFSQSGLLAVYRTPPPIIGQYQDATLQNFDRATRIWWMIALFPMLKSFFGSINQQAIWPIYGKKLRLWFDLTGSDIGLLLLKDRGETAKILARDLGYPTNIASARVGLGMPYVPELDRPNMGVVVAGREPVPASEDVPEPASASAGED